MDLSQQYKVVKSVLCKSDSVSNTKKRTENTPECYSTETLTLLLKYTDNHSQWLSKTLQAWNRALEYGKFKDGTRDQVWKIKRSTQTDYGELNLDFSP